MRVLRPGEGTEDRAPWIMAGHTEAKRRAAACLGRMAPLGLQVLLIPRTIWIPELTGKMYIPF